MDIRIVKETKISGSIEHQGELRFEPDGDYGVIEVERSVVADRVSIKAGWSIKAGGSILALTFEVRCTFLATKRLPFWREFYATMPPLTKWADAIRSGGNCWASLRSLPSREEAEQICAWDGWHWILRAQLEMFFGLKERVVPPEPWRVEQRNAAEAEV